MIIISYNFDVSYRGDGGTSLGTHHMGVDRYPRVRSCHEGQKPGFRTEANHHDHH